MKTSLDNEDVWGSGHIV